MKKLSTLLFSFCFLFLFMTCKKKSTIVSYTPSCSGTKSYSTQVAPLISVYCASCHSSYNTYTQAKASASSIRNSVVNGSMPKGTSLSEDQKNNIVCWIDAGCPNN